MDYTPAKVRNASVDFSNMLCIPHELLFTVDLVKDMLDQAYRCSSETDMIDQICEIIETCWETENPHFIWFGNMLNSHLPGIVAHAYLPISSAKMEGINNKIKTVRRQKLDDVSRNRVQHFRRAVCADMDQLPNIPKGKAGESQG